MDYIFPAKLTHEPDGGFLVSFPDVPEALTQGDDIADARRSASEALGLALRGYAMEGRPFPPPSKVGKGLVGVTVDAADALKLAVIDTFRASGLSKSELARLLGKADNEAHRILDPDHPTKVAAMEAALRVLGKEVVVSVRTAA